MKLVYRFVPLAWMRETDKDVLRNAIRRRMVNQLRSVRMQSCHAKPRVLSIGRWRSSLTCELIGITGW
jgi:hypothetical protein